MGQGNDQALPSVSSVIGLRRPLQAGIHQVGRTPRHGVSEVSYQQSLIVSSTPATAVWIDGYDVNGKTFFVIFRPADGIVGGPSWTGLGWISKRVRQVGHDYCL